MKNPFATVEQSFTFKIKHSLAYQKLGHSQGEALRLFLRDYSDYVFGGHWTVEDARVDGDHVLLDCHRFVSAWRAFFFRIGEGD